MAQDITPVEAAPHEDYSYKSIISSRPFRFLVGHEKREYMLHAAVAAHQSKSLDKLVNGEMKEAREGCAIWEEMDEDTFIRFSEYAYTGDYRSASPHQLVDSSPGEPKVVEIMEKGTFPEQQQFIPLKKRTRTRSDELWDAFKAHIYTKPGSEPDSRQNKENENYTEVFLSHAKLFVFADYHGIPKLEMLALHKLRNALVAFNIYRSRIKDVAHLIRYSYANTIKRSGLLGGLRGLVTGYAACKIEELWKSHHFQDLLKSCGDFANDVVGEILKRLH